MKALIIVIGIVEAFLILWLTMNNKWAWLESKFNSIFVPHFSRGHWLIFLRPRLGWVIVCLTGILMLLFQDDLTFSLRTAYRATLLFITCQVIYNLGFMMGEEAPPLQERCLFCDRWLGYANSDPLNHHIPYVGLGRGACDFCDPEKQTRCYLCKNWVGQSKWRYHGEPICEKCGKRTNKVA